MGSEGERWPLTWRDHQKMDFHFHSGTSRVGVSALASECSSSWRRAENRNKAQSHTGLQLEQRFEALKCGTRMFLRSFTAERQTPEPSQGSVAAGGWSLSAPMERFTVSAWSALQPETCYLQPLLLLTLLQLTASMLIGPHWHASCCNAFWDWHQ